MNILSAIYAGRSGFTKASQSLARNAARVAKAESPDGEALVQMKLDSATAKANLRTIEIASDLAIDIPRAARQR